MLVEIHAEPILIVKILKELLNVSAKMVTSKPLQEMQQLQRLDVQVTYKMFS